MMPPELATIFIPHPEEATTCNVYELSVNRVWLLYNKLIIACHLINTQI